MNQIPEAVFLWVIHNFQRLKQLIGAIAQQRDEYLADPANKGLEDELNVQFKAAVKDLLTHEIATGLQLNAEEVMSIVEDINIEEFLK